MTLEDRNVAQIQELYRLYAQGKLDPVYAALDESICWRSVGPAGFLPWSGECSGHDGVRRYFQTLREAVTVETYEPQYFVAQGERVVAVVKLQVRDNTTGRASVIDKVDIFRLQDGKIREFTEIGDMAAVNALRMA